MSSHDDNNANRHNHDANNSSKKNILIAFVLNFSFAIIEIFGGIITNSTAILSDAIHDFGDSLALLLSLIFERISRKKPNAKYTFGYKRISVLGALVNIIILSVGTVIVVTKAVQRFLSPMEVMAEGMFVLAIIGIVVNGISVLRIKGSKKILDKTVMLHLLEDLLGWIAVVIVSVVIYFTNWYLLDPILSLAVCIIIGRNIFINAKSIVNIIMHQVPNPKLLDKILLEINASNKNIYEIKNVRFWSLDGEENVFSCVIVANGDVEIKKIKDVLLQNNVIESTIEITYHSNAINVPYNNCDEK